MIGRAVEGDAAARARAWHHGRHTAVCDVVEPWQHGTVVRATRYPDYYDFNLVRVEDDPGLGFEELAAFADDALAGLAHRRLDFDVIEAADRVREQFETAGWHAVRLLFMRHETAPPADLPGAAEVEEVDYDRVHEMRVAWHREDYPDQDPGAYHEQARDLALRQGAQVFAVREEGEHIAFAQLQRSGDGTEIAQVFVDRGHRGRGLGTALTRAAIDAAGNVADLWIVADDEDRAKDLYARLGFRPVWLTMEFTRLPR
jgi:ribosomal protein S18 acetylase RimI-like enzyme